MNYKMLESAIRTENHVEKILDLIAGDCREAECVYLGIPGYRIFQGRERIGDNNERCFQNRYLDKNRIQDFISMRYIMWRIFL